MFLLRLFPLLALCGMLAGAGCDGQGEGGEPMAEGTALPMARYGDAPQPSSRADYARLGVVMGYGSIHLFDPGSGPSSPPRFLRRITASGVKGNSAQVDAQGYVWLAAPDLAEGGVNRYVYIVDPHAATVHRRIALPEALRGAGNVLISGEWVYLYAWRNGFSAGIGRVPKACATDAARCEAVLFTELGTVSTPYDRAMHVSGDALFVSSTGAPDRSPPTLFKISTATGAVEQRIGTPGQLGFNREALFVTPGTAHRTLLRVSMATLEQTASAPSIADEVAVDDGRVYVANRTSDWYEVRDAATLALVSAGPRPGGAVTRAFGFVAPGMLMLNGPATMDVRTGTIYRDPASAELLAALGPGPHPPQLPEGHPYAY